jgi:hypothetical protein
VTMARKGDWGFLERDPLICAETGMRFLRGRLRIDPAIRRALCKIWYRMHLGTGGMVEFEDLVIRDTQLDRTQCKYMLKAV